MFRPSAYRCVLISALGAVALSGCVAYGTPYGDYSHRYPYPAHSSPIPKGHLPPPGECRIWFPDRPPGQQPSPGNCYDLERRVPSGATLIRG